ncbi:MAG: ATP-dependent helicase [Actinomycetota bacterium]
MSDDMFVTDAPVEVYNALGGKWPTSQQWAAISAPLEPSVLVAGAGSGKTAVMAARIVWLIVNGHAKANEILGLTFTNKAAETLLERVRNAIRPLGLPEGEEPTISTYHGFASGLIVDYGLRVGIEPGAALLSEAQAWQLCAELYSQRTYQHMEARSLWHVGYVRQLADDCSNHLVTPDEVIAWDRQFLEKIANSGDKIAGKIIDATRKRTELADVVDDYQAAKAARRVLDYGDQIRLASEIAEDGPVVRDFLARFRFALLDEYQDTNVAQAKMLRRLMPDGYPVMAVGDPDQNIYAWRGASLHNLLAFPRQFPRHDGSEAHVLPLEVNFRSGLDILTLANHLIDKVAPQRRAADKVLRHYPALGKGTVAVGLWPDQSSEARGIAEEVVRARDTGTPWREIAILCRKKRLFDPLVEELRARDIPIEVIGLGGLLKMPEIVDLVALLRVLEDPMRNVSLARLLRGPRWRIGHRDLALIARRAADRNRSLKEQLGEFDAPGDVNFSLAEAVAACDEVDGLSDEARARIARFNAELTALRAQSHLSLQDLAQRALEMIGIVAELDASPSRAAPAARHNLANFLDRVAAFQPLEGEPTLASLIEWLDAVEDADEEIEAAQPTDADSVKLMTIHQAKGLEFDVVIVPGLARGKRSQIFPDISRAVNPYTSPQHIPTDLRGDAEVFPRFMGNLTQYADELKVRQEEEERRLFYVVVTRARNRLVCTAAHWYYPSGMYEALTEPLGPSEYWQEVRAFPDAEVIVESDCPEENPLLERRAERAKTWPPPARREPDALFPDGLAAAVSAARAKTTPDPSLFPPIEPSSPVRQAMLNVTSIVTYAQCPKKFYWSFVRPLPRKSSAAARIGTIVHSWIEQEGKGQIALVDPAEFEERMPAPDDDVVATLKKSFESSRFYGRSPVMAERSIALVVGDHIVQGRMDAIFERDGGGWEIVDWKSGRTPEEEGAERWQLDLYALAAQEIWGKAPDDLTVTFVYLRDEAERSYPGRPAADIRAELEGALAAIAGGLFEPIPGSQCRWCDFKRDCAPGAAWLAEHQM